jgi:hypothetical protein
LSEPSLGAVSDRGAIRDFISTQRGVLEAAQAGGTLARTKLDVMDAAEAAFSPTASERERVLSIARQELDAFCDDMRLASVTVQQQVERLKPKRWGLAISCAVGAVFLALLVMMALIGSHASDTGALLGFGIPLVVGFTVLAKVR